MPLNTSPAWEHQTQRFDSIFDAFGDMRIDAADAPGQPSNYSVCGGDRRSRSALEQEIVEAGYLLGAKNDTEARRMWCGLLRSERFGYEPADVPFIETFTGDGTSAGTILLGSIRDPARQCALLSRRLHAGAEQACDYRALVHALADRGGITVEDWLEDHKLGRTSAFACFSTRSTKKVSATLRNKIETVILAEAKAAGLVAP
jgi:hypothetical protein